MKTKKTSLLFFLSLFFLNYSPDLHSQVSQQWVSRFNGTASNSSDQGHDVVVDKFGNVYVTGHISNTSSGADYITVKYNSAGDTLWTRKYDGPGAGGDDYGFSIVTDLSGNVYVTGYGANGGAGSVYDIATIKYNSNGDSLWISKYRGPATYSSYGYDIRVDNTGNVYVTGATSDGLTNGEFVTIKYNSSGTELWSRRYGGPGTGIDYSYSIDIDVSGNVYVTGISVGNEGNQDFTTIKYSATGDSLWVRRYNGSGNDNDYSNWIAVDDAGNSYIAGASYEAGMQTSFTVIKYLTNGDTHWMRQFNGPGNSMEGAYYIMLDSHGDIYAVGNTSATGDFDCLTIKFNSNGDILWTQGYNGTGSGGAILLGAIEDKNSNVYVTGFVAGSGTSSDVVTIKYSSNGNELWAQTYNGTGNGYDGSYSVAVDTLGGVYVTGYSEGGPQNYDYVTIKYSQMTGVNSASNLIPENYSLQQNYPNPFNPKTIINYQLPMFNYVELKVYDLLGNEVYTLVNEQQTAGNYSVEFDGSNLPSGTYFYRLIVDGNTIDTKQMTLLK